jgi:hypothetical protein
VVFVEPWVDRVEEVGIQIEVPRIGNAQLAGITQLVCNDAGQYQGSWFTNPPDAGGDFSNRWRTAVDIALRAAEKMQDRGYFGPLGIDALRYRLSDGSLHVRPLQDINARWTMGRLSLGWKSFLLPNKFGFWWHFARNDPGELLLKNIVPFRHFASSPACIGKRYAQHRSMIIIGSPPSDH